MEIKTTIPGLKFVVGKVLISRRFADFFIDFITFFVSTEMNLGRLPLHDIEISEWIRRLERLELGGLDFSYWKGLRGAYKLAEALHRLQDPSFSKPIIQQLNALLPPDALDAIKKNLDRSAFDEVNRLCNEAFRKAGAKSTFDMVGLMAIIRAAQTGYRCVARYRVSPIHLIEQAHDGDRQAVLTLIKLDKLFCRDNCTKNVLQKALLGGDKRFNDQVARAQLFKPEFGRRDACEVYMILLAGLRVKLPPLHKLRAILDPDGTVFPKPYAFDKCFERLKKDLRLDPHGDVQPEETCHSES